MPYLNVANLFLIPPCFLSLCVATTSRYGVFRSIGDLPDDFEHHADIVVGCVMLGLGLYGYAKVFFLVT